MTVIRRPFAEAVSRAMGGTRAGAAGCRWSGCACRSRRRMKSGQPSMRGRGGAGCRSRATSSGSCCRTAPLRARMPIRCRRSAASNKVKCWRRCGTCVRFFREPETPAPRRPDCGNDSPLCSMPGGSAPVGDGRPREPRSSPAARHSDEHAGTGTAAPVPGSPFASETQKQSDEVGTGTTPDPKPPGQGALF